MSITHYQDQRQNTNIPANKEINKEISVNSLMFRGKSKIRSFPKQITIDTEEITFVEAGMHYILQKGHSMIELFDMSDGTRNYRLQFNNTDFSWKLLRISPLPR